MDLLKSFMPYQRDAWRGYTLRDSHIERNLATVIKQLKIAIPSAKKVYTEQHLRNPSPNLRPLFEDVCSTETGTSILKDDLGEIIHNYTFTKVDGMHATANLRHYNDDTCNLTIDLHPQGTHQGLRALIILTHLFETIGYSEVLIVGSKTALSYEVELELLENGKQTTVPKEKFRSFIGKVSRALSVIDTILLPAHTETKRHIASIFGDETSARMFLYTAGFEVD